MKTMDRAQEILEQIIIPGMDSAEWDMFDGQTELADHDLMSICEEYHRRGLFANDDALTNTIRYGVCCFIGDAMRLWEPCDALPPEVVVLWDECQGPGPATAIPWELFDTALPWLLYHAPDSWWDVCYDGVMAVDDSYYWVDVRCTVEDTHVSVQIGAGWADDWVIDCHFEVTPATTREEFVSQINAALPWYMEV